MKHTAVALMASEDFDLGVAQDRQALIRAFADAHEIVIVSFLVLERDSLGGGVSHAMSLCKKLEASMLLVDRFSTIFIPHKELAKTMEDLVLHGIVLACASEAVVLEQPMVVGFNTLLASSIACDQELRSNSIKKSLKTLKQKGGKLGAKPFGTASHESTIIKQILKLHEDGFSLQKICDLLVIHNIKTSLNKKWHPTTVKRIIERHKKQPQKSRISHHERLF